MLAENQEDIFNKLVFGVVNRYRYRNWKGETENTLFIPLHLRFGRTEHHPEDQWLVEVYDVDKQALRTYALAGIQPR